MATHPRIEEWVDLARNVANAATAARLRAHSLRCASCRRTLDAFRAVAELGLREHAYAVSSSAWKAAVELAPRRGGRAASLWTTVTGRLVFDSLMAPAFAGVRSHSQSERHLTYRSGDWEVDLRLERVSDAVVSLLGQVATSSAPQPGARPGPRAKNAAKLHLAGIPVRLVSRGRALASTALNEFGEFQLECSAPGSTWRLEIPLTTAKIRLDVPVLTDAPTPRRQATTKQQTTAASGTKRGNGTKSAAISTRRVRSNRATTRATPKRTV